MQRFTDDSSATPSGGENGGRMPFMTLRTWLVWLYALFIILPGLAHAAPFAYISNYNSNNVSVIDTATNTVAATVAVGANPFGVAVNPAGTFAYVANANSNNVSVINTATNAVVATVPVGASPLVFGLFIGPAPAPVVATAGIPTLSEWALLLLAGLVGLFGMGAMRRRPAGNRPA